MMITKRRFLALVNIIVVLYLLLMWLAWRLKHDDDVKAAKHHDAPTNSFRPQNGDVLVFFHIQKTGGTTFNTHLVQLDIKPRCTCTDPPKEGSCRCRDAQGFTWLFSRFTTSSSCGVHPPLEEFSACAPRFLAAAEGHDENTKKRYLVVTVLREPIQRYLSEWRHVQHVPPWPTSCRHIENPVEECITKKGSPISLEDFIDCPGNPANNRMVRMLTQEPLHLCDAIQDVSVEILSQAKAKLENLAFVGITERQEDTKELFEATFGVQFLDDFEQEDAPPLDNISDDLLKKIQEANKLDIELYTFANKIFDRRQHKII